MQAGCFVSRGRAFCIVIFFIFIVVGVGLLAGLIRTPCKDLVSGSVSRTTSPSPPARQSPWLDHRLPSYVLPDHYDLTLHPDFYGDHHHFYGNVSVWLNITEPTDHVLIHVKDMNVTRTTLRFATSNQDAAIGVRRTFAFEVNEYWVVESTRTLQAGSRVVLEMDFDGSLTNGIVGLYKSTYVNRITGKTRHLATSKFQPTDARKAFPCFDEPGFKSTFTVTLIHDRAYTALSNMPQEKQDIRADGLAVTRFQKSVSMVTYLACFIVCDFEYRQNTTQSGVPFRVYATPDKMEQVDYALDVGVKVLNRYEDYFGLRYPLPKMDMIAIPDFVSGAMEHWGLITYRETNLLYDDRQASEFNKQRVAVVVAHELAHMWFGNLVTMKWWDELWLNEGFASFLEYKGVQHVHPDWDMDAQFVVSDLQRVMPDDSKVSSHPIIVPVSHPSQITEVFDSISYAKGASVIRMLETFMGETRFREGIQAYMRKYEYKATVTDDLWAELQKVSGAPVVKDIMDTWTRQMGYPVLNVTVTGSKVKLTQTRFLVDPNADTTQPPSQYKYKWKVPVTYKTSRGISSIMWMNRDDFTFNPPVNLATEWIKLNVDQTGYYRVNYEPDMWRRLGDVLQANHRTFSPADRSSLLSDAFSLAGGTVTSYDLALGMMKYLGDEEHYVPWATVNSAINYIDHMLRFTLHYGRWQTFVRDLASPVLVKIGYDDVGNHLQRSMRSLIIRLACGHDDSPCLRNVTALFKSWMENDTYVSPNLRSRVYEFGMQKSGGEEEWEYMWDRYRSEVVPQHKNLLLYGLTSTREPWLLNRLLDYAMDADRVRSQDFFTVVAYLASNTVGRPLVWDWVRIQWPSLVERFGLNHRYLGRMVPRVTRYFNTEFQLAQVQAFFGDYPEAGAGERARQQALEQIRANIVWMTNNGQVITDWLKTNVP